MSEVNSEEEIEVPHHKITDGSPIKKGDFMTYSQLQKKINSVIPDEETVSYNTSVVQNSQLTYSMSQFERSNLRRIEEVSESQHSLFSQLQRSEYQENFQQLVVQLQQENNKLTQQIVHLKETDSLQKKQLETLNLSIEKLKICQKVELDELREELDHKARDITKLQSELADKDTRVQQFDAFTKEQQKMIDQKDKQLKEVKNLYDVRTTNLQQVIDDQTESIKTLHKQVSFSQNNSQISTSPVLYDKIKQKQQSLKQAFDELSKLYDEVSEAPQTPTSSKKQILSRTPSRSIHLLQSPPQYNTEPKKTFL